MKLSDGCTGKRRHRNRSGALIHMEKLGEPGMNAYHCRRCGGWHIGHVSRAAGVQSRLDRLSGPGPKTGRQGDRETRRP